VHKFVLQPKEEGTVEIVLDARRFSGTRTRTFFLQTREKGGFKQYIFRIQADSDEYLEREQREGL
jgi:hypothetical protein